MSQEVEQKIKAAVAEHLSIEESDIQLDSSFTDDLGADSLDLVELVMAFETSFGITIPEADASELTTVRKVVEYINERK